MPSVELAMERSLRAGFADLLAASMRPVFQNRDVITDAQGQIADVKTAFSSWDNCMKASFCKWPVIAIIIVGGLILISIIWCMARCLCCGLSCCCECCYCLKCCGDCCGCCDPPKKKHKYLDDPYSAPPPPPTQGYRSQAPMAAGFARAAPEPPQYAEFDVSKKGGAHEDALPEMPSWETAGSKKVLLDDDPMELHELKKPDASGHNVPLMTGVAGAAGPASPSPSPDPRDPYGHHGAHAASSGYLGQHSPGAHHDDPYALGDEPYGVSAHPPGPSSSSLGVDHAYGAAGAGLGAGRRSPRAQTSPYGRADQAYPGDRSPQGSYEGYSRSRQGDYNDVNQQWGGQGGGMSRDRRSPPQAMNMPGSSYPSDRPRLSPGPQTGDGSYGGGYNNNRPYPSPQRQYSSDSTRPLRAPPQRQQYPQEGPPVSPIRNNSGFDFNSGYSRPQTAEQEYDAPGRPQPGHQGGNGVYPGYRAYQPQQQGWSGL